MLRGQDSLKVGLPGRPRPVLTVPAWCLLLHDTIGVRAASRRPHWIVYNSERSCAFYAVAPWRRGVRHGRYVVFQLASVTVSRILFAAILRRIDRLRGPPVATV